MQHFRRLTRQIQRWFLPYLCCLCLGTFLFVACAGGNPPTVPTAITPGNTTLMSSPTPTISATPPATPNAETTREFIAMCENRARESEGARNLIDILLKEVKAPDCRTAAPLLANLESLNLDGTPLSRPDDGGVPGPMTDLRPLLVCQRIRDINFYGQDLTNTDLTPLSRLTTLAGLSFTEIDVTKLEFLKPLTQLRELGLGSGKIIRDFSALAGLTQLRSLVLEGNSTPSLIEQNLSTDLSPLANLQQLETLTINQNQVTDITPLKGMKQLQRLSLRSNKITSLQALAGLTNLTYIDISENQVNDLRPLAALSQLDLLDLISNRVKDLQPLVSLRQLRDLRLKSNQIEDITPLAQLSQLAVKTLDLSDNQIRSVKGLENFKALDVLLLENNKIKDIQPLAALTKLRGLYLSNNYVRDLRPLATLQELDRLELTSNLIHDLRPLVSLRQLTHLELAENQIKDITPLGQLSELYTLNLANNRIQDASALKQLKRLRTLNLQNNPARLNRCPLQNVSDC
jgi:internalin A